MSLADDEIVALRERLAEALTSLDAERITSKHLRIELAEAEALLREIRGWFGSSVTTWPQRIDAFLKETAP